MPASRQLPTPLQDGMAVISRWEGLWQAMAADPGNYLNGRLIGTMRGVTPAALLAYITGLTADRITPEYMRATVTLEVAADIFLRKYYRGWFDPIRWQACASSATDFGWGAGPGQAVLSTERDFLMVSGNYAFDPVSIAAWSNRDDRDGMAKMADDFAGVRERFYDLICARNPSLQQYRQGWHNRTEWYRPSPYGEWWAHWNGADTHEVCAYCQPQIPTTVPAVVLSQGMAGADVLKVQQRLVQLGYKLPRSTRPSGALDGVFGPELTEIVKRFQADRRLNQVDGWVGVVTRHQLFDVQPPAP